MSNQKTSKQSTEVEHEQPVEAELVEETEVISVEAAVQAAVLAATEETNQKLLRLQADFDNFRRRTRLEKEDAAKYAAQPVLTNILPALDNLDRAIAASRQSQDFEVLAKGVEMTVKLLVDGLEREGLQIMDCVGVPFNPEFHQAVMQVESDEFEDGVVVEELQKGYMLKDRVIRPAMVKVNSKG